ncbi:MAG: hypothetical protein ACPIOQ_36405, partial [Promethearchaeia archaeon]
MSAGGGRDSDAILFMPGGSPKNLQARGASSRFEQFYSATGSESASADAEGPEDAAAADPQDPRSELQQLQASTESSLDWSVVRTALANCSVTSMGRRALETMRPFTEVADVERSFAALEEVRALAEQGVSLPVGQVLDIIRLAGSAGKGEVLDLDELKDSSRTLQAMQDIAHLLDGRNDTLTLTDIAQDIDLDAEVVRLFARSFDAAGQLSVRQYP